MSAGESPDRPTLLGLKGKMAAPDRIKLYDFRRPDKFSREQIRTMQNISEDFARLASIRLSASLRLGCDLSLDLVDQMTYSEFMDPLAAPSTLAVAFMEPLKGQVVLHVDAGCSDAIVERLFGAVPAPTERPLAVGGLTDIECSSMEGLIGNLLSELGTVWNFVEGLAPRLLGIETEPRFCQVVPPLEMIILTSFSLNVGAVKGKLDIVYPFLVLEPIISRLSAKHWYSSASLRQAPADNRMDAAWKAALPAQVICDAGAVSIDVLKSLRKGSVIPVDAYGEGRAWLRLGGARVAELSGLRSEAGMIVANFEGVDPASPGDAGTEAREPVELLAGRLLDGIKSMNEGVSGALSRMERRIDDLKGGQDDLSDRVLYGQADSTGPRTSARPFASISGEPADALALFLAGERPQLVALVLSFLDDALGARVLSLLPEAMQPAVAARVARMDRTSQEVMSGIERVLEKKLSTIERDCQAAGGLSKAVGLLNLVPRATEKLVIEALDASDPALAQSIKRNMFVFEDIIILDEESIGAVLAAADERDILTAMKPMAASERERLFGRIPLAERERLKTAFAAMGRVRLSEADTAGQRVVAIIRRLEEEGRIGILREGE